MVSTTNATRKYCATTTVRSSAPSSPATAASPVAPPAIMPNTPVTGSTSRWRPNTAPASTENTKVATAILTTAGQWVPNPDNVSGRTDSPMVTARTPWAAMTTGRAGRGGPAPASATMIAISSAENNSGAAMPIRENTHQPASVAASSTHQRAVATP